MPAAKMKDPYKPHRSSIMMITEWKQRMMEAIAMDDTIAKLLKYNSTDALSRPDLSEDEKMALATFDPENNERRIYPTRYTPSVVMDQQSFIGLGISGFVPQESWRQFSEKYVMGYLYFYILVDNSIMEIDEGQRQDLLLQRIYDLFQDSDEYGMGHIQEGNLTELWEQNNKFGGYSLMMRVIDFK
ncbi:hypothetical protein [Limosilactobacillus reuteri]|uniref:hypothetical protein n=1 Tax=Limosilactobacillus reuteri TaxID=1598 RepID=UPI001E34D458|nr:hypothetical protein [Limosilactobacillus reuteri]MCC4466845.1 hypothetical protein [Limosilactobacillus reuteri]MCC4472909.1 hypothetical protein [Limosilactobacillus reuteri]